MMPSPTLSRRSSPVLTQAAGTDRCINNLNTSSILQARANTAPQPFSPFIVLSRSPTNCPVNAHWRPYVARCGYCSTNYTVIARMDTFAGDLAKISSLAGVRLAKDVHSHGSSSDGHHPTTARQS